MSDLSIYYLYNQYIGVTKVHWGREGVWEKGSWVGGECNLFHTLAINFNQGKYGNNNQVKGKV